ncbi:MAG TPA: hypothetical protein VIT93_01770 [Dehalococcoidia bacterium]
MCLEGASVAGHDLLLALADRGLRSFYVWTPVLDQDDRDAAVRAAVQREHAAARHYWDTDGDFAPALAAPLGLTPAETPSPRSPLAIAWDVYLTYPPGDRALFALASWMHQLPTKRAPRLDPAAFRRTVEELLPQAT